MPTYEYQCRNCGHHLEAFQKISEQPLTTCPNCQQETLSKQVSATNFQLKGTGWYVTDFRNKSSSTAKDSGANTASDAAASKSDSNSGTGS